jgi:hypothetical protein
LAGTALTSALDPYWFRARAEQLYQRHHVSFVIVADSVEPFTVTDRDGAPTERQVAV